MRTGLLCGREHLRVGGVAAIAEGRCGIALSIGGARKTYDHTDPNEDAVGFAEGEGGILVAVADGHGGCEAAEIAVQRILEDAATGWTAQGPLDLRSSWREDVAEVFAELNAAILDCVSRGGPEASHTTLALALVRPAEDLLAYASIGDSHVFHVARDDALDIGFDARRRGFFLGFPAETRESLRERCVAGFEELHGTRAVVLATDGLSERGIGFDHPEAVVAECSKRGASGPCPPLFVARRVCERALASHRRQRAGDNVATATVWIDGIRGNGGSEAPQ